VTRHLRNCPVLRAEDSGSCQVKSVSPGPPTLRVTGQDTGVTSPRPFDDMAGLQASAAQDRAFLAIGDVLAAQRIRVAAEIGQQRRVETLDAGGLGGLDDRVGPCAARRGPCRPRPGGRSAGREHLAGGEIDALHTAVPRRPTCRTGASPRSHHVRNSRSSKATATRSFGTG
jgi:hypothetical protein